MFPDGGGTCTWRARRCKAKQGRHGKTALTYESYLYSSTDFAPRTRGVKDLFGNTHLRSYFVCHASPSVTHLSFAELFRLSRISVTHLMSRISAFAELFRLSRISCHASRHASLVCHASRHASLSYAAKFRWENWRNQRGQLMS